MYTSLTTEQILDLLDRLIEGAKPSADQRNAIFCLRAGRESLEFGFVENARCDGIRGLQWLFGWGTAQVLKGEENRVEEAALAGWVSPC